MPYMREFEGNFGVGKEGLKTVGYQLKSSTGEDYGPRETKNIYETRSGYYKTVICLPDNFMGSIVWDTGEKPKPQYSIDAINPPSKETTEHIIAEKGEKVTGTGKEGIVDKTVNTGNIVNSTVTVQIAGNETKQEVTIDKRQDVKDREFDGTREEGIKNKIVSVVKRLLGNKAACVVAGIMLVIGILEWLVGLLELLKKMRSFWDWMHLF